MKNLYLIFVALFVNVTIAQNTTSFSITDPRNFSYVQGKIDSVELDITPEAGGVKYELYMQFYANSNNIRDTFESVLNFKLPSNAAIIQSWLWIENYISEGLLIDRDTASQIYESIVNRRKDPSILFKNGTDYYTLRVFPVPSGTPRKVKITYLVPTEQTNTNQLFNIPLSILKLSNPTPSIKIRVYSGQQHPSFMSTSKNFNNSNGFYEATLSANDVKSILHNEHVMIRNQTRSNLFLAVNNSSGSEGYYQLNTKAKNLLNLQSQPRNVCLVIDNHLHQGANHKREMLESLRQSMLKNLTSIDSFQIVFGNNSAIGLFPNWLQANEQYINVAFDYLISNYDVSINTSIEAMLDFAVNHVKNQSNKGEIILVTNTKYLYPQNIGENLANHYKNIIGSDPISISVIDYDITPLFIYSNTGNYFGNTNFYNALAVKNNGVNKSLLHFGYYNYMYWQPQYVVANSFIDIFDEVLVANSVNISNFEINVSLANGFCFQNYKSNELVSSINKEVITHGRFFGSPPFIIESIGSVNGNYIFKRDTVSPVVYSDSVTRKLWANSRINDLESRTFSSNLSQQIKSTSLSHIVLSKYTSFLALERVVDTVGCELCTQIQNPIVLSVLEGESEINIELYPNPIIDYATLKFTSSDPHFEVSLRLLDLLGKEVFHKKIDISVGESSITLDESDLAQLNSGIYSLVLSSDKFRKVIRVVKR